MSTRQGAAALVAVAALAASAGAGRAGAATSPWQLQFDHITGVNDAGQMIGDAPDGTPLWSDGTTTEPVEPGLDLPSIVAINAGGEVVGTASTSDSYGDTYQIWTDTPPFDNPTLAAPRTEAAGIDKAGDVAGTADAYGITCEEGADNGPFAFVHDANGDTCVYGLGISSDATYYEQSRAYAMAPNGDVIGTSTVIPSAAFGALQEPFLWPAQGRGEGTAFSLDPGEADQPIALNDEEQVILERPDGSYWLWQSGSLTAIPSSFPGFDSFEPEAIDDHGVIAGEADSYGATLPALLSGGHLYVILPELVDSTTGTEGFVSAMAPTSGEVVGYGWGPSPGPSYRGGLAITRDQYLNTQPGTTSLALLDPSTADTFVTASFGSVTAEGITQAVSFDGGPTPPAGVSVGTSSYFSPTAYFQLTTTAQYTGALGACVDYSDAADGGDAALSFPAGVSPRLYDYNASAGSWTDTTTSSDASTSTVCGTVGNGDTFALFGPAASNTPAGASVSVSVADGSPAGVSVTFSDVTTGGDTTVTRSSSGPTPPAGFSLGSPPTYWDVSTTAVYQGTITVCFDTTGITPTGSLVLLHNESGTWVTVPTTQSGSILCGTVTSLSPFTVAVAAGDTTPPSISVSHETDGVAGWNVSVPVTISITAADAGSGLAGPPACTDGGAPLAVSGSAGAYGASVSGEGTHAISCTAADAAGNTASAGDTVRIDTRAPVVSYSGDADTYTLDQTVAIACSASDPDPGSGLASSSTCAGANGPAYTFQVGQNQLTATAVDVAGNTGHGSASFTVVVTPAGLCRLTAQLVEASARFSSLPARLGGSAAKLAAVACADLERVSGTLPAARKAAIVRVYDVAVAALARQRWLSGDDAATLTRLAAGL